MNQPMWDKHLTGRVDWELHTDDRLDDHDQQYDQGDECFDDHDSYS